MRVNFFDKLGKVSSSTDPIVNSAVMTGPLIIAADPVSSNEANTKQYVDGLLSSLNASNVGTGVFNKIRFPGFSGDVISSAGTGILTLSNTGVAMGSYNKVTVDGKGRVVVGTNLTTDDIPVITWDKIVVDKPTTLNGYGIGDALSIHGGLLTGNLSVQGTPVNDNDAVTLGYYNDQMTNVASLGTGDVIRYPKPTPPPGYLQCNGGGVMISDYRALHQLLPQQEALLDTTMSVDYSSFVGFGAGKPWQQQYGLNNDQLALLGAWNVETSLPALIGNAQVVVTRNYVYLLGGTINNVVSSSVYKAPINTDGTLGAWSLGTSLPAAVQFAQVVVTKNRVYLLGGDNGGSTSSVYTTLINADGTLGSWTSAGALPYARMNHRAVVMKNRIYLLGGVNNVYSTNNFHTASIDSDGLIGTWSTESTSHSVILNPQVFVTKNRIYVTGGNTAGADVSTIYTIPVNEDGTLGTWTTVATLPVALSNGQVFVTTNRVYLIGGHSGSNYISNVYTASIDSSGIVGTWSADTSLPATLGNMQLFATKSKLFILGGYNGVNYRAEVYSVQISGAMNDYSFTYNGSINKFDGFNIFGTYVVTPGTGVINFQPGAGKPWKYQNFINTTLSSAVTFTEATPSLLTATKDAQVIVTKNKVHLIGGRDAVDVFNHVQSATIDVNGEITNWIDNRIVVNQTVNGISSKIIPIGTKQLKITAKGGDGGSLYSLNLTGTGSGTLAANVTSLTLTGKGSDGVSGWPGGGKPWKNQYEINTTQSTDITGWYNEVDLPVTFSYSSAVVTKNRIYLIGGYSEGAWTNQVWSTVVNGDGTLGTWALHNTLPAALAASQAIVTKNRVYLLGGYDSTGAVVKTVYTAVIDSNGLIGSWSVVAANLPAVRAGGCAFLTTGHAYFIGGESVSGGTQTANVYRAVVNADGTLGSWAADGTTIPVATAFAQSFITKNRVYIVGGLGTSNGVFTAPINADGTLGTWATGTNLPSTGSVYSQSFVTKDRVYLLGKSVAATVYTAPIDANGLIGSWTTGTSLLGATYLAQVAVINGIIFMLGGLAGPTTYLKNVRAARISGGLSDYTPYYDGSIIMGTDSTVTINGTTYTFLGGNNGPAVQSTQNLTLPGISPVVYSYNIATGGSGSIVSQQVVDNVVTISGVGNFIIPNGINTVNITAKGGDAIIQSTPYTVSLNGTTGSGTIPVDISTVDIVGKGGTGTVTNNPFNISLTELSGNGAIPTNVTSVSITGKGGAGSTTYIPHLVTLNGTSGVGNIPAGIVSVDITAKGGDGGTSETAYSLTLNDPVGSGTIPIHVSSVSITAKGGDGSLVDVPNNVSLNSASGNGSIPSGVSSVIVTGKGGDGVTTATPFNVNLNTVSGSGSVPANVDTVDIIAKGGDGTTTNTPYTISLDAENGAGTIQANVNFVNVTAKGGDGSFYVNDGGKPWVLQHSSNALQSSNITGWVSESSNLPGSNTKFVVTKNHVYAFTVDAGVHVYVATIDTSGVLSTWTLFESNIDSGNGFDLIITNNKVYKTGGTSNLTVTYAINADGTLGNKIVLDANSYPYGHSLVSYNKVVTGMMSIATKKRVYFIGGYDDRGYNQTDIVFANINIDGTLGTWSSAGVFPVALADGKCFITKDRVYVIGGIINDGTTTVVNTDVYMALIDANGVIGSWTTSGTIPKVTTTKDTVIVTNTQVYLFMESVDGGGIHTTKEYRSTIDVNGLLGAWTTTASLPDNFNGSEAIITKDHIYLLKGLPDAGVHYVAPFLGGANTYMAYLDPVITTGLDTTVTVDGTTYTFFGGEGIAGAVSTQAVAIPTTGVSYTYTKPGTNATAELDYTRTVTTTGSSTIITLNGVTHTFLGGVGGVAVATTQTVTIPTTGVSYTYTKPGTNATAELVYSQISKTTGLASTVTLNGTTYTFPGGVGTQATQSSYTATTPTNGASFSYSKPGSGSTLSLSYDQVTPVTGTPTTISINGSTYTFPGGVGGPAAPVVQNVAIPTTGVPYSYSLAGPNGTANLSYVQVSTSTGQATTVTVNGSVYTFPGGVNGPAIEQTQTAYIPISGVSYSFNKPGVNASAKLNYSEATVTAGESTVITIDGTTYTFPGGYGGLAQQTTQVATIPSTGVNFAYTKPGSGSNLSLAYNQVNTTTGIPTTVTLDGTVYTFPGGVGGVAPEVTHSVTIPLTGAAYTFNKTGSGASVSLNYAQSMITAGPPSLIVLNGVTYTFPGGTTGAATPQTQTVALPGTSSVTGTHDIAVSGSATLGYTYLQPQVGENATFTINGTMYTFPGGVGGPAVETIQNVTLPGTADLTLTYSVPFNGAGAINYIDNHASIVQGKSIATNIHSAQVIVTKNRAYLLGGRNETSSVDTVYTAVINSDGTLGAWGTAGFSLPVPLASAQALYTRGKVYLIGGLSIAASSAVYVATVDDSGIMSAFSVHNTLPAGLYKSQLIITYNKVYVVGGFNSSNVSDNSVYVANLDEFGNLGTWINVTTTVGLPVASAGHQIVTTKNAAYLIGGYSGASSVACYKATIDSTGTLTGWAAMDNLPTGLANSQILATSKYLYLLGGETTTPIATVYRAAISGSKNSYAPYYDGTVTPTNTGIFNLPDYTSTDTDTLMSIVKY